MRFSVYLCVLAVSLLAACSAPDGEAPAVGSAAVADVECSDPLDTEPCAEECACSIAFDQGEPPVAWQCVHCLIPENCGATLVWQPVGDIPVADVLSCEP